jgi:PAS domain S-box-containing protein
MKLLLKVSAIIIAVMFLACAVIYYITWYSMVNTLGAQSKERLEELAITTMDKIDRTLFERRGDLEAIVSDPIIRSRDSSPQQITERLIAYRNIYKTYASLSFFDLNRTRIADTTGLSLGKQDSKFRGWDEVLQGKLSLASDIGFSKTLDMPVIFFASPVRDKNNELFGVVIIRVPVDKLYDIVGTLSLVPQIKENVHIDLIDKDGLVIYSNYNRKGRLREKLPYWETLKTKKGSGGFVKAHRHPGQEESVAVFCREQGYLSFKGNEWTLIIHIPTSVVFAPVIALRNKWLLVIFAGTLLAIISALTFSIRLSKPLTKLRDATVAVGRGDMDTKLEIRSRDEIGELSDGFNQMVVNLKKTTTSIDSLEREITARRKSENYIRRLNQLQLALLDPDILERQLKKITDGVVDIFNADFCRIWLIAEGDRCTAGCPHAAVTEGPHVCRYRDKCLHLVASSGRYTHLDGETHRRVPFGCYKIGGIASGEYLSFLTNNVTNDPRVHNHEWAKELGLVSFAGIQLRPPHGDTKGVLALFSQSIISDEEYALLEGIGNLAMRVMQTAQAQEALRESEERIKVKLDAILSPEADISNLDLRDIIDGQAVQSLMDAFFAVTRLGVAIIDIQGNILVATGWQDICVQFHRVHPESHQHCIESDTLLSTGVSPGSFKLYRCKNNLWDMATPILVGGNHLANLFLGQFLFEDEVLDEDAYRAQARHYGFDELEYIGALRRVPRWSRETVNAAMTFCTKLADLIAMLSHRSVKLARALTEREELLTSLRKSEERWQFALEGAGDGVWDWNAQSNEAFFSRQWKAMLGFEDHEIRNIREEWDTRIHPEDKQRVYAEIEKHFSGQAPLYISEHRLLCKDGSYKWILDRGKVISRTQEGKPLRVIGTHADISERKRLEDAHLFLVRCDGLPGEDFFQTLARYLAASLNMDYVCIDRLEGDLLSATTLAIWFDGNFMDNVTYALKDTPCGVVVEKKVCVFPKDVRHLFPTDVVLQEMGAESYVGAILWGSAGQPIGIIAVIGRKPLGNPGLAESILKVTAIRAAGELERRQAEQALQDSEVKYRSLFEYTPDALMMIDGNNFVDCNTATLRMFQCSSREEFLSKHPGELSPPVQPNGDGSVDAAARHMEKALREGSDFFEWVHRRTDGSIFPTEVLANRLEFGGRVILEGLVRDITERKRAEEERKKLIGELRASLAEVKTLSGLLPICASCKKIRDDKGYWNRIESYITDHSEAEFSHGICPACAEKLYPEVYRKMYPESSEEEMKNAK